MHLIDTPLKLYQDAEYLNKECEPKIFGKLIILCSDLELEYIDNNILIHQSANTKCLLKMFNIENFSSLSTFIVVLSFDSEKIRSK